MSDNPFFIVAKQDSRAARSIAKAFFCSNTMAGVRKLLKLTHVESLNYLYKGYFDKPFEELDDLAFEYLTTQRKQTKYMI